MPLAKMYDDVSADNYPTDGDGNAAYVNGIYADFAQVKGRFPSKPCKSISVWGMDSVALSADVADCEDGDYTPGSAAHWAYAKIVGGLGRPTLYCSLSLYDAVAAALASVGLAFGRDVDWWEADYDGVPELSDKPGSVAKQYQSTNDWDVSVVLPSWLFGTAPPTPTPHPPAPPTATEDPMVNAVVFDQTLYVFFTALDGSGIWAQAQPIPGSGWASKLLPTGVNLATPQRPEVVVTPAAGLAPQTLHLFAQRQDGHCEHHWMASGGTWQGPESE